MPLRRRDPRPSLGHSATAAPPVPVPAAEAERLLALRELDLLDRPAEPAFDAVVALTARLLDAPMAFVNLIDADRHWTMASVGTPQGTEIAREHSFCAHTICEDELLIVPDTRRDPRFARNPVVAAGVRFYWGAPVATREGHRVGTLCVAGRTARRPTDGELQTLRTLAEAVAAHVELRRRERLAARDAEAFAVLAEITSRLARTGDIDGVHVDICTAARRLTGADGAVLWRVSVDGCLEAWASMGAPLAGVRLDESRSRAVFAALERGERCFVAPRDGDRGLVDADLAARLGAATAALEPMLVGARPVGLLCAWWTTERTALPERVTHLLRLLAGEATVAFQRGGA